LPVPADVIAQSTARESVSGSEVPPPRPTISELHAAAASASAPIDSAGPHTPSETAIQPQADEPHYSGGLAGSVSSAARAPDQVPGQIAAQAVASAEPELTTSSVPSASDPPRQDRPVAAIGSTPEAAAPAVEGVARKRDLSAANEVAGSALGPLES